MSVYPACPTIIMGTGISYRINRYHKVHVHCVSYRINRYHHRISSIYDSPLNNAHSQFLNNAHHNTTPIKRRPYMVKGYYLQQ